MNDPGRLRHRAAAEVADQAGPGHSGTHERRRFYEVLLEHLDRREAIAVATVVAVRGSASARLGSRAIITLEGRNRFGWVGGGCAESFVIQQAQEALRHGVPRRIEVDLNDEAFGVGMPCGGHLEVFIEPMNPPERLLIVGDDDTAVGLARWARRLGYQVSTDPRELVPDAADALVLRPGAAFEPGRWLDHPARITAGWPIGARTAAEEALSLAASLLLRQTAASGRSISRPDGMIPPARTGEATKPPHLVIIGHNRITEHLASLGSSLDWTITVNSPGATADAYAPSVCRVLDDDAYELEAVAPGGLVVIATQHRGDHLILKAIADREPAYVGVIASRTRAGLLREFFGADPAFRSIRDRVHAPCGLDLGARSPFEIALAIVCELVAGLNRTPEPPP